MKIKIRGLLLILSMLILSGCDEVGGAIENAMNKGNHKGVQLCVDKNETDILSAEATLRACVQKHEKVIISKNIDGLASIGPTKGESGIIWHGEINNNSLEYIVTHVVVAVYLYDDDGKKIEFSFDIDDLWIEPGKKKTERETIEVKDFKPFHKAALSEWCADQKEREKINNCKAFDFPSIKAVTISVD